MKLTGVGMTLTGAEGASPPLPFIEVDDAEGEALLERMPKMVVRVDVPNASSECPICGVDAPHNHTAEEVDAFAQRQANAEPEDLTIVEGGDGEAVDDGGDPGTPAVTVIGAASDVSERQQTILDAIDLLDAETGFVKHGPRAGKPGVKAVEEVLGEGVTSDEIDAAIAAKGVTA